MNLRHIWIVFSKEVKDIARDKKTIITSIIVPMVIIPLLSILAGGSVQNMQRDIEQNITIALTKESNTPEIRELITEDIIADFPNIKLVDVEDPIGAINNSEVRAVLDIDRDYKEKLEQGKTFVIEIIYDESHTKSLGSVSIISNAINEFKKRVVANRLEKMGLDDEIIKPVKIEETNIANDARAGLSMLSMILPVLLIILISAGGIAPATDLVAGEKERNTFEPLLTTKAGRSSILIGKYLTVALFSFVSAIASILGMVLGYFIDPKAMTLGTGAQFSGFSISGTAILLILIISVLMGMTFAGIQIALSTYAKSFREAQTYLSFLIIIAMIPGYATILMQPNEIPLYMYVVPILNTISAFKTVLGVNVNYTCLAIALTSSVAYVIISLRIAISLFNKERVLFRS
ncbi:ABC transporter permease [Acetivibrio clariflavus]|uniref:ABC-type Na+ efflux pump, permease component n=1 Tax=Acetivibrio clariflavus (strain DSM 19732 / NBRC 101661 / EBR45) TaxID=720554 RepID=G8LTT5_ACECE|nr:ABC transporter permease [Acetivibrio clariflavus]AEV67281.1 ABC-type Na+ efflux pump, permease component [Acetivibrio clariflavus DSM 19732]